MIIAWPNLPGVLPKSSCWGAKAGDQIAAAVIYGKDSLQEHPREGILCATK